MFAQNLWKTYGKHICLTKIIGKPEGNKHCGSICAHIIGTPKENTYVWPTSLENQRKTHVLDQFGQNSLEKPKENTYLLIKVTGQLTENTDLESI